MTLHQARRDPGSFRDPSGHVYLDGDCVLRTITGFAEPAFAAVKASGLLDDLVSRGWLLPFVEIDPGSVGAHDPDIRRVLEHPKLPLISYPYEWGFAAHRRAALLHIDVHLAALDAGMMLSDATAFNVQFRGAMPVFIDHLSFRPYRPDEIWAGHRQFCMHFLNPLILHARGIRPNAWFRGALEGIAPEDLARILPRSAWLSWTVLSHVVLQASLQRRGSAPASRTGAGPAQPPRLPLASLKGLLAGLRGYIEALKPSGSATEWSDYAQANSYSSDEATAKRAFVAEMVGRTRPRLLWDIGCNTGDYSVAAIEAGAENVVGWDFDHGALDKAFARAEAMRLPLLPLWLDAANPSPSQGWAQNERRGFAERADPDALIALAFIHHIAIGRNIPLARAVDWLIDLAPVGVIEFPSKADAMVQRLLRFRDIPFADYTEAEFLAAVSSRSRVVRSETIMSGARTLIWYDRTSQAGR